MMADISIIIVNWNTKDMLAECINGVRAKTRQCSIEVIVVDNGSSDGSQEELRNNFKDVILIENCSNLGFSRANNIGIKAAKGKYICLLNSDTVAQDGIFDKMFSYMEENSGTGILGPAILNADSTLRKTCRIFPNLRCELNWTFRLDMIFKKSRFFALDLMTYFTHDNTARVDVVPGSCMMIRKSAIDRTGLLEEMFFFYAEDVDICKRMKDAGWDVVYYPEAKIIHYGGVSSSKAPLRFIKQLMIANIQYWHKHYGRLTFSSYLLIKILHYSVRLLLSLILFLLQPSRRKENLDQVKTNLNCLNFIIFRKYTEHLRPLK